MMATWMDTLDGLDNHPASGLWLELHPLLVVHYTSNATTSTVVSHSPHSQGEQDHLQVQRLEVIHVLQGCSLLPLSEGEGR